MPKSMPGEKLIGTARFVGEDNDFLQPSQLSLIRAALEHERNARPTDLLGNQTWPNDCRGDPREYFRKVD